MNANSEEKRELENILPDAKGLFYALRSMGYDNTAAIADLIDNSIDAEADNVWVTIDSNLDKIFIADDGVGMSDATLHTAIKLGGKKAHDTESDLGKYGLGLITASISLGRVVRIITKNAGIYNTAILDYDEIVNTNTFCIDFHESTEREINSFDYRTNNADSGTVLIIDNCDKLQYTTAKSLAGAVEASVGQVFRVYLNEGRHIYINDSEVAPYDPLLLAIRGVKRLVDTDIDIKSVNGTEGKMHVLAVAIPDQGVKANRSLHLNITGQGFYILRNNREIAEALEFSEIFKKHNDYNLLRIELSFGPDLDDLMGINLKKHDIAPSQEVINALKVVLDGPIKKHREEMKKKQKEKAKKNPFIEEIKVPTTSDDKPADETPTSAPETGNTFTSAEPEAQTREYTFTTYVGDEKGPLFKVSTADKKVTIYYNICNEYYSEKILLDDNGTKVKDALDNVIKSSMDAYLETVGSDTLESFANKLAENFNKTEE